MSKHACSECGAPISGKGFTGRCRRHILTPEQRSARRAQFQKLSADPDIVAKRQAKVAVTTADPAWRQQHSAVCAASMAQRMADPDYREIYVQSGRNFGKKNLQHLSPESRAKAALSTKARNLSWCPPEYWQLNERLKAKGFLLPERQEIILAEVPGTVQHARRENAKALDAMRFKAARERAEAY